ncbi:3-isopropylmalate dehydratase small subunit [bacterium]|nr:3-isopropylmalate dehydratase small subunit [bacterium]
MKVVIKLEDDVSTDAIYPGRFMATVLPNETPQFAFADHSEFNSKLKRHEIPAGSFMIAGKNFGCGSSREQAASCLRGYELVVIAKSFGRIFMQNAINLGLRVIVCPTLEAAEGDELEIENEFVVNKTNHKYFPIEPLPKARQAIMDAGGLIPYTRKKLIEKHAARPH